MLVSRLPGYRVILGVDPAVSTRATADLSAITAVLCRPDGSREVIACDAGRWPFGKLVEHIAPSITASPPTS